MTPSEGWRTAVVTITAGRDEHLHRQRLALAAGPPDLHVIVAMGALPQLREVPSTASLVVEQIPAGPGGLPLASARNAGARAARRAGAEVIVFLDVDCIPAARLVARYRQAVQRLPSPALVCGPVSYLPPAPPGGYPVTGLGDLAAPHGARPAPPDGHLVEERRFELFWSLSFAVSGSTWTTLGGFDEEFVGYGAEDTDFALRGAAAGARLYWVGGAEAYHQHHAESWRDPARVAEMTRNARRFYLRHGSWPMRSWLEELAAANLVDFDPERAHLEAKCSSSPPGLNAGATTGPRG